MTNHPSQKDLEEIDTARNHLGNFQTEWLETLEDLAETKEDMRSDDLFSIIYYLTFCDEIFKNILLNLNEMDFQLNRLFKLKNQLNQNSKEANMTENLIYDLEELRNSQRKKIQSLDEEYSVLAEETLRHSEDLISKYSLDIQKENTNSSLQDEINQTLDKESFLQELKDSLETYREAREDLVSELTSGSGFQKFPGGSLSEDLGEEKPEIDSILSQLDTLITGCDMALLIKEIED